MTVPSEGEYSDRSALENAFIILVGVQDKHIFPKPANADEVRILQLYESGYLADEGYEGVDGDLFLQIKWKMRTESLPEIGWLTL